MKASTLEKIDKAIEDFKKNVQFEIETSNVDPEVKDLCEQIAKYVYYTLHEIHDALSEN